MSWDAFDANGTRITQGRYDFLGKLVSPAVAVTGATTATVNRMHYVTGTSADYTITLPSAAVAGNHLAFMFGPTLTELSKLVTVNSRPYWAGEGLFLESDGAAWVTLLYNFKAMACTMIKASQSINPGTDAKVTLDSTVYDNTGLMANTGSSKMTCRRTGRYSMSVLGYWLLTLPSILNRTIIYVNGGALNGGFIDSGGAGSYVGTNGALNNVAGTAGQDIELYAGNYSAGAETVNETTLMVVEQA